MTKEVGSKKNMPFLRAGYLKLPHHSPATTSSLRSPLSINLPAWRQYWTVLVVMSPHPNTLLCIFWMGRGSYKPSRSAAAAACPYELSNSSHAKHKNVIFVVLKPARADDDATQNASSHYVYCGDGLLVIPYFRNAKTRKILEQQIKNTFSNYTTFNRCMCLQIKG